MKMHVPASPEVVLYPDSQNKPNSQSIRILHIFALQRLVLCFCAPRSLIAGLPADQRFHSFSFRPSEGEGLNRCALRFPEPAFAAWHGLNSPCRPATITLFGCLPPQAADFTDEESKARREAVGLVAVLDRRL